MRWWSKYKQWLFACEEKNALNPPFLFLEYTNLPKMMQWSKEHTQWLVIWEKQSSYRVVLLYKQIIATVLLLTGFQINKKCQKSPHNDEKFISGQTPSLYHQIIPTGLLTIFDVAMRWWTKAPTMVGCLRDQHVGILPFQITKSPQYNLHTLILKWDCRDSGQQHTHGMVIVGNFESSNFAPVLLTGFYVET
jgi:hypothetical protein